MIASLLFQAIPFPLTEKKGRSCRPEGVLLLTFGFGENCRRFGGLGVRSRLSLFSLILSFGHRV